MMDVVDIAHVATDVNNKKFRSRPYNLSLYGLFFNGNNIYILLKII